MTIGLAVTVSTTVLGIISWGLSLYSQLCRARISHTQLRQLQLLANTAVLAAEELSSGSEDKYLSALNTVLRALPELEEDDVRDEIHAAIRRTGIHSPAVPKAG